ncbi:MAG: DUF5320 domain-containing protein [Candidatus Hodarchaeota archaeon]
MSYSRSGWGRGRGCTGGRWPGNGPFRNLPPWERPGWLYGRGSCWTLGYWDNRATAVPPRQVQLPSNRQALERQRNILQEQLKALQETVSRIEKRLSELED